MHKGSYEEIDPIDAILAAAAKDPAKRYHFYRALLNLELVVPGTVTEDGEGQEEPELLLKYIETEQELVLPVFSSTAKFQTIFQEKYTYVKIEAKDLLPLIEPKASLVLNPGFDLAKKIIPEEIDTLQDGSILQYFFNQLPPDAKEEFLTEGIVVVPDTTLASLSDCLRSFPSIKKAYLTHMFDPVAGGQPYPLVGIEVEGLIPEDLLSSVVKTVMERIPLENQFEFAILNENLALTSSTIEQVKPFYIKNVKDDLTSMFR